jgi:hypothetical protein
MLALAVIGGCQREESDKLVELSGRIFVFNYRVATATYLVTLRKTAPLPEGSIAEAVFENPRGGETLITREKIFAVDDRITLESPHLQCVMKNRSYAVTIRIFDQSGKLLQQIDTSITSDLDQTVLPSKPLVIGPGYAPHPEVFKADGTADLRNADDCPK